MITANGRTIADVDAANSAAAAREESKNAAIARKRQNRLQRERHRRRAHFTMPEPRVSAAAKISKSQLMGRR